MLYEKAIDVTTSRWGFGFYRPEALVTVLTNETLTF